MDYRNEREPMKIYSWYTLLVTLLVGGGGITWLTIRLIQGKGDIFYVFWIGMGIYLACKGLKASLTKEGYEEDQRRGKIGKRVYKKLFGRLAPIMPYSTAIIFLITLSLAALLIRMLWKRYMILPLWIFVFMMMIPVGYAVWFSLPYIDVIV